MKLIYIINTRTREVKIFDSAVGTRLFIKEYPKLWKYLMEVELE